ncbi:hypothetical protein D3C75_1099630 [compost metagenome]
MSGLFQNLLRTEHSCFEAKNLSEFLVIDLGISGSYNENGMFVRSPEGERFGNPGRNDADGCSGHLYSSA